MEGKVIKLELTQSDIDELNRERFHHPDPMVMKRCETVFLHAKGMKTGQIRKLTGMDVKTIRAHLHLYENGGIKALKQREPYRPKGELEEHKKSIEDEFRQRPPATIREAGERIFLNPAVKSASKGLLHLYFGERNLYQFGIGL